MDEWLDPANNPRERGRRLEEDSNQDFIKGYAKGDDIPIRRAFNAWIDGGLCSEIDYQTPDTKSFALHNTQDKVIRSIADLDEHHAPRVQMACKVARQHRWHVFLGRLRSSWYGPKDRSPNRQMKKRARESPDRPPPPGIRTLSDPDSYPFNNVEETEQSLIELHTIEGDMVVPGGEGYIRDLSLIQIDDYHFIQDDFLPLKPETEEEKRPKNQKGPWVKQTWHTNVRHNLFPPLRLSFSSSSQILTGNRLDSFHCQPGLLYFDVQRRLDGQWEGVDPAAGSLCADPVVGALRQQRL